MMMKMMGRETGEDNTRNKSREWPTYMAARMIFWTPEIGAESEWPTYGKWSSHLTRRGKRYIKYEDLHKFVKGLDYYIAKSGNKVSGTIMIDTIN